MILHPPKLSSQGGYTVVWSRIEVDSPRPYFPEFLWYRVPDRFAPYLSIHGDAFLPPALHAAMGLNEPLEVLGPVSPRLAYHLDEYKFIIVSRFPRELHNIPISLRRVEKAAVEPEGVGVTFSGGVDSLYTLHGTWPLSGRWRTTRSAMPFLSTVLTSSPGITAFTTGFTLATRMGCLNWASS